MTPVQRREVLRQAFRNIVWSTGLIVVDADALAVEAGILARSCGWDRTNGSFTEDEAREWLQTDGGLL